ncbi:MAG: HDOD domain-containing protein, partial [Gammaproteobacteria bacterium]|nr:HDOD domain-containing protein [Gammaproteobacteria bacterium]
EILEHVVVDQETIARVKALNESGYIIALDDFVYDASWRPLLELVKIIKIDVMEFSEQEIERHLEILKPYKLKLLAEKIETHEKYQKLRDMGFDYFQGYFLSRPNIVEGEALPANRLSALQLLGKLQDPDAKVEEMEKIISQDVTLSYKLLRYLNSSWFALSREIASIRSAIIYLGQGTMRSWATMVAISSINDQPNEITTVSLLRGRMCELLAEKAGHLDSKVFFTVGLFSSLDALMNKPMAYLLGEIPLASEIKVALLNYEGEKGRYLRCVRAYEEADWENVTLPGIEAEEIRDAYLESITWAREAVQQL